MKTELIQFAQQSFVNTDKLNDIVDTFTNSIMDLADTASDLIKPIKAFRDIYGAAKRIRFKMFLKSYSKNLHESYESEKELVEKMNKYLRNNKNLNFVYDTIDSALNSKSVICSGILGYLSGKVLTKQIQIGYKELVFLNALKNLNDFELKYMIIVFENTDDWSKNQTVSKNEKLKPYLKECEYTVQKLKTLQVVNEVYGRPGNPVGLGQAFWGTYLLTEEFSRGFFNLIKESGFYEEIKNDN